MKKYSIQKTFLNKIDKKVLEAFKELCVKIGLIAYQIGYSDAENGKSCDLHYAQKMLKKEIDKGLK